MEMHWVSVAGFGVALSPLWKEGRAEEGSKKHRWGVLTTAWLSWDHCIAWISWARWLQGEVVTRTTRKHLFLTAGHSHLSDLSQAPKEMFTGAQI